MSDSGWFEIEADADAACQHFERAVSLYATRPLDGDDEVQYVARMAFMHAMLAAHTSMESALLRVMDLLGEDRPRGDRWHADLVRRAASPLPTRPAMLPPELARAAHETRKFRHRAMYAYDDFVQVRAQPAAQAASILAGGLRAALTGLRRVIDP